ncbi:MAG: trigger factor [Hyphomicrobiaceae bacterium]
MRQLKVVVPAAELNQRFAARIDEVKDQVQIKGFRKGKVPLSHIKKVYGRSLMVEVMQAAVEETSRKAMVDREERPAMQPKIDLPEDSAEIEKVIDGKADLAYGMTFEVLPKIQIADFAALKLERMVADVEDSAVDKAVGDLVDRSTSFEAEDGRAAGDGDRVTMDFVGKIDGEAFEGGAGEGVTLVIGQGGFIPGFEDGLKGIKAGEERAVTAAFPAEYGAAHLAGKTAVFDVKVTEVAAPKKPEVNDEFAKTLGAPDLAKLREMVKMQLQAEHERVTRARIKRQLLDELEKAHDFALPPSLVDSEFESVWTEVISGMKQRSKTFEDEGKTEESAKAEYRKIAERRVRLGLVIGEVGETNKIQVTQDEMRMALMEQARRFPGQEKFIYEYYEKTPGAVAQLRAPIFEDKVVDHIVAQAQPVERKVTREELFKPLADEAE